MPTEESTNQKPSEPSQEGDKTSLQQPNTQEAKTQGDKPEDGDKSEKGDSEKKQPTDPATKRRRIIIGTAIGIVVLVAGIAWWLYSRTYESTDDAQVDGHLNSIASRVSGTVKAVYAENDQPVKAGQTLVDLDPSDYEVQVAQARAAYKQSLAQTAAED